MAVAVARPLNTGRHSPQSSVSSGNSPNRFMAVNGRQGHMNGATGNDHELNQSESQYVQGSTAKVEPSIGPEYRSINGDHLRRSQEHSDTGSSKRKRLVSDEGSGSSSQSRYDCSPPKRLEQPQHMADRALHVLGHAEQNGHQSYPQYSNGVSRRENGHLYDTNAAHVDDRLPNGTGQDPSESHLAEALQRATHDHSQLQQRWGSADGDSTDRERGDNYGKEQTPQGSTSGGPKRKRNFSNRTKTGCLTCRRRKKKCDEQHPKCNNCVRGGFDCEGYNIRDTLWKPHPSKIQVALQSKDGYREVTEPAYRRDDASPPTRQVVISPEGGQMRPIAIEDNESGHGGFTSSPQSTEPRSRTSYPGQPWPQQGHGPYSSDHLSQHADVSHRPEARKPEYTPTSSMSRQATAASQPSPAPNPQTGQWPGHSQSEYRANYPPARMDSSNTQPASRVTNSNYKSGARTFGQEEVEKSRMRRGAQFNFLDPTLRNERQRCEEALDRYNGACKLRSGLSGSEAGDKTLEELLWKVLDPSRDSSHAFVAPHNEKGSLGPGVRVEAPFSCSYGYNITLQDHVYIGKYCTIDDGGTVDIGSRTTIGPNVTILTTDVSKDMIDRKGTEGRWFTRPVRIESNVIIGHGAVLYPGVHLGRGSIVEPFAIVKNNLQEGQTQQSVQAPKYG